MEGYRLLEFKHLEQKRQGKSTKVESLQTMFNAADEDSSGDLDLAEIMLLFEKTKIGKPLTDPDNLDEFIEVFSRIDRDHSGSCDFAEFLGLLREWEKTA